MCMYVADISACSDFASNFRSQLCNRDEPTAAFFEGFPAECKGDRCFLGLQDRVALVDLANIPCLPARPGAPVRWPALQAPGQESPLGDRVGGCWSERPVSEIQLCVEGLCERAHYYLSRPQCPDLQNAADSGHLPSRTQGATRGHEPSSRRKH